MEEGQVKSFSQNKNSCTETRLHVLYFRFEFFLFSNILFLPSVDRQKERKGEINVQEGMKREISLMFVSGSGREMVPQEGKRDERLCTQNKG